MKVTKLLLSIGAIVLSINSLSAQQPRSTREEYIARYRDMAIRERDLYGIPAAITMAQGILESDNGNSRLATEANNHFGIKCRDWSGPTIRHDDDALQECFRAYDDPEKSYRDHSEFLQTSTRYASLFKIPLTDYQGWAYGLKAAGYATNPQYAQHLIRIIEDHKLYLLDDLSQATSQLASAPAEPLGPSEVALHAAPAQVDIDNYLVSLRTHAGYSIYPNNGSDFILARAGDTWAGVARKFGVSAKKLRKFNDAPATVELAENEMVYVRKKAKRAENGKLIHVAEQGESLRTVSQTYGVRLSALAALNLKTPDTILSDGQQIRLK